MINDAKAKTTNVMILLSFYLVTAGVFYLAVTRSYHSVDHFNMIRVIMLILMAPIMAKYGLQLICLPLYSLTGRYRDPSEMPDRMPTVSVLIPAWNEEVGIVKTIRSVLNTRYPGLQIVVVNDGSTDRTHEKVIGFMADRKKGDRSRARIDYIRVPNGGKAKALNRGLREAEGDIVITVDADSVMAPTAITNLVRRFRDPGVGAVAGHVVIGNRRKAIEWLQEVEYLYGFFFKRVDSIFNSVYIIGGAAAAYRRKVLLAVGGFDHDIITEDIEMSTRILKCGYKTRYASDAVIFTECPSDLKGLCNQRLRWKYGRILTFIKHRSLFFSASTKHNPYLTFLLLPIAVYAEFILLLEAIMLGTFFIYTAVTSDYMPLAMVISILGAVFLLQAIADAKHRFHRNFILIAPVVWLLFYAVDVIEFQALFRSLKRLTKREELKWQRWVRVGILQDESAGKPVGVRL